jgi:hypothetical protein
MPHHHRGCETPLSPHPATFETATLQAERKFAELRPASDKFLSNLWIGRLHDNQRLPLVLAGGLGGTLQTGRTLSYLTAADENRRMCSLYLSIMDRFGVKLDRFGDADTHLQDL